MDNKKSKSPWLWVPSLYFFEGLPYFIVNTISKKLNSIFSFV